MPKTRREFSDEVRKRHPELDCFPIAVRNIALRKKLLLKDVIKRSGISASTFFSYTNDNREYMPVPRIDSFYAVADGLGVDVKKLIQEMRNVHKERTSGESPQGK